MADHSKASNVWPPPIHPINEQPPPDVSLVSPKARWKGIIAFCLTIICTGFIGWTYWAEGHYFAVTGHFLWGAFEFGNRLILAHILLVVGLVLGLSARRTRLGKLALLIGISFVALEATWHLTDHHHFWQERFWGG